MTLDRRSFIAGLLTMAGVASPLAQDKAPALSNRPVPLPSDLLTGDLLWPKRPGVFVPYRFSNTGSPTDDAMDWTANRDRMLDELAANLTMENVATYNALKRMSYPEFRARYLRGTDEFEITRYGLGSLASVGHVGIVDIDAAGEPWVVEALLEPGVVRTPYAQWVSDRPDEIAWQGRVIGLGEEQRRTFVDAALQLVGRPYDFWNFDLGDDRNFYCSKLVWLAGMRSFGFPIDGNPEPRRTFWLSPKQVLYAKAVEIVLDQGNYAFD